MPEIKPALVLYFGPNTVHHSATPHTNHGEIATSVAVMLAEGGAEEITAEQLATLQRLYMQGLSIIIEADGTFSAAHAE